MWVRGDRDITIRGVRWNPTTIRDIPDGMAKELLRQKLVVLCDDPNGKRKRVKN